LPGTRPGGRAKGTPNKATIVKRALIAQAKQDAFDGGLLPLQIMLARMRDEPLPNGEKVTDAQLQAAALAAPYIHPRLSNVDATVNHRGLVAAASDEALLTIALAGRRPAVAQKNDTPGSGGMVH
jgi:hypothetical protein